MCGILTHHTHVPCKHQNSNSPQPQSFYQTTPLFAEKSRRSLKPDSLIRIWMRRTSAASKSRNVCVALVDNKINKPQKSPTWQSWSREGRGQGDACTASGQKGQAKLMVAKAKVANRKHGIFRSVLQSPLEMGHMENDCFTLAKKLRQGWQEQRCQQS